MANQSKYARQDFFVENQVILIGSEAEINQDLAGIEAVQSDAIRVLRLNELGETVIQSLNLPPDMIIGLYRLIGDAPDIKKAIEQIDAVSITDNSKKRRRGEPNYLTGHPWEGEGSPWEGEGSPWEGEGSPWEGEGSPNQDTSGKDKPAKTLVVAQPAWFMGQWAFDAIELDNPIAGPLSNTWRITGKGVRVAVLDTSPYFPGLPEDSQSVEISCLAQDPEQMVLHVAHPLMRGQGRRTGKPAADYRNHGYFIAGLVHAVAPECELHLIRVLDHSNSGDLFTLEEALFDFLKGVAANPPEHGAVINMSLGICVPPKEARFELPEELASLYTLLEAARSLGVVVTAAAGNETHGANPRPAEVPAAWDIVLGVASSNNQNERSSFSNCGRIAAPGGDGDNGCQPCNADCVDACFGRGVVGPVLVRFGERFDTRYVFWSGSSFSAPLVSGLAALVMEAGGHLSPQAVEAAIINGASPVDDPAVGAGVINVRATLSALRR